jgi:acyl-CoA synthetase (NDP forming)
VYNHPTPEITSPPLRGTSSVGLRRASEGVVPEAFRAQHIPCYEVPEDAARAMDALVRYGEIRRQLAPA